MPRRARAAREGLTTVAVKRSLGRTAPGTARRARPRADRGGGAPALGDLEGRRALRPRPAVHDRGRVHADGRARRIHAQARRRAHRRADDYVVSYNVVGSMAAVLSGVATLVVVLKRGGLAAARGAAGYRGRRWLPRRSVATSPSSAGYLPDESSTDDADLYDPASDSWSRLPDLPVGVNHAAAASAAGKLYVVGGYGGPGVRLRSAYVFDGRTLAEPRADARRARRRGRGSRRRRGCTSSAASGRTGSRAVPLPST